MRRFDLVIFDMDGTLYPNNEAFNSVYPKAALNLIQAKYSLARSEAEEIFAEKSALLMEKLGCPPTNTLVLLSFFDKVSFDDFENEVDGLIDVEGNLTLDPQTVQTVEKISGIYQTALFTTNNEKVATRVLRRLGLESFFPPRRRFTLSTMGRLDIPRSEQLRHIKPSTAGFELVLKSCGAIAQNTLMVGDSEHSDIRPAQRLGMSTFRIDKETPLSSLRDWLGLI